VSIIFFGGEFSTWLGCPVVERASAEAGNGAIARRYRPAAAGVLAESSSSPISSTTGLLLSPACADAQPPGRIGSVASRQPDSKETPMAESNATALYTAVYDDVNAALADLEDLDQLHKDDVIGKFDAAVVDVEEGRPHIVKRMDRPRVRVIPEDLGGGMLPRKELKEAAEELHGEEAGLIVMGEPTIEKAFDKAVQGAAKVVKKSLDATTDEIAKQLQEASA
jgi:hypothetical protein